MQHLFMGQLIRQTALVALYQAAKFCRQSQAQTTNTIPRRVVHVSPAYFSDHSYIGGGERYATALAETMATRVETVLISFGDVRRSLQRGQLRLEIYRKIGAMPDFISYMRELINADVIHCHQYRSRVTNLTILISAALGKPIFVTDHGGEEGNFTEAIPLHNLINGFLTVSNFSGSSLPKAKNMQTIYGGVDKHFFDKEALNVEGKTKILFVGRVLPHKGINYLIEAIDEDIQLDIIGRIYDEKYFFLLQDNANNKKIKFVNNATDVEIINAYQSALVTVLPSVYLDINHTQHLVPELLGLTLLESMACGTPVICTNVGGMPEIVIDGVTGFVVPPNDSVSLRERIYWLLNNPEKAYEMGKIARTKVFEKFTWDAVTKRCLKAYNQRI